MTRLHLLPVSARTPRALKDVAQAYCDHLRSSPELKLEDVCYSAALRRTHHEHRLAVIAGSREDLVEHLDAFAGGRETPATVSGRKAGSTAPSVAFLFPAASPAWSAGAGRLAEEFPAFADGLDRCERLLGRVIPWSLSYALRTGEPDSRVAPDQARICLFALQVALTELWRSWGVRPQMAFGAGVGELTAAWAAGALTLEQAIELELGIGDGGQAGKPPIARLFSASAGGEVLETSPPAASPPAGDVDLSEAWRALTAANPTLIVEVTPDAASEAIGALSQTDGSARSLVHCFDAAEEPAWSLLRAFGRLYTAGLRVDWKAVTASDAAPVPLPSYVWQHKRFWWDEVPRPDSGDAAPTAARRRAPAKAMPVQEGSP